MPSFSKPATISFLSTLPFLSNALITHTYSWGDIVEQYYPGIEYGYNNCSQWMPYSQDAWCDTLVVNDITDLCLWAPPESNGVNATIANTEREEVAWCMNPGYGTRLLPDDVFTGLHMLITPNYVQFTGVGDFTKIGIPAGDEGGELDAHGYDGKGNPIGGMLFSSAFSTDGSMVEIHEWMQFISASVFCIRICPDGPDAEANCNHVFDEMGCEWVMPGNYDAGVFETCDGPSLDPPGVYGNYTFAEGDSSTPSAHPTSSSSDCVTTTALYNNPQIAAFDGTCACEISSGVVSSSAVSSAGAVITTTASVSGSVSDSGSDLSVASATGTSSSFLSIVTSASSTSSGSGSDSSSAATRTSSDKAAATSSKSSSSSSGTNSNKGSTSGSSSSSSDSDSNTSSETQTDTTSGSERLMVGGVLGVAVALVALMA